jgi:hypothetical protein
MLSREASVLESTVVPDAGTDASQFFALAEFIPSHMFQTEAHYLTKFLGNLYDGS